MNRQAVRIFILLIVVMMDLGCKQTKKSELEDAPCVIFKPKSTCIIIGQHYEAEIILTCDQPDSINGISFNSDERANFFKDKGKIFCSYLATERGKNIFKGELVIKCNDGRVITHHFEESFFTALPDVVISVDKFNWLIEGQENSIRIGAPGFADDDLIVTATNAVVRKDSITNGGHYYITPINKNDVQISTVIKIENDTIPLGTIRFKIIKNNLLPI